MGAGLPTTGDGLLNKGQVDIPMGEFWTPLPGQKDAPEHPADLREAASAAHIYGKTDCRDRVIHHRPANRRCGHRRST